MRLRKTLKLEHLLAELTAFIVQHRAWAGPIIGLVVLGETLAVVGMFFPATPIMFAIGGMIGAGTLPMAPILGWATAGAILGYGISYSLGHRAGPSIYYRPLFRRHRMMFAKARLFFRQYGFLAIFVGRFLGPVRATVPLVSGVVKMNRSTFQMANIISACVWVTASFAPGYIALAGLGSSQIVTQSELIAIGGLIALLSLLLAIGTMVLATMKRAKRRAG